VRHRRLSVEEKRRSVDCIEPLKSRRPVFGHHRKGSPILSRFGVKAEGKQIGMSLVSGSVAFASTVLSTRPEAALLVRKKWAVRTRNWLLAAPSARGSKWYM
jgi:hypothetical protein